MVSLLKGTSCTKLFDKQTAICQVAFTIFILSFYLTQYRVDQLLNQGPMYCSNLVSSGMFDSWAFFFYFFLGGGDEVVVMTI